MQHVNRTCVYINYVHVYVLSAYVCTCTYKSLALGTRVPGLAMTMFAFLSASRTQISCCHELLYKSSF